MRRASIQIYKERLEAERAALIHSLEITRQGPSGEGNRSSSANDCNAAEQSLIRESRLLWIVESALEEIAEGRFGRCLFCQRRIPPRLLANVPWSAYCRSCQKLAEAYVSRPCGPK